jgi:hypothetical protein
MDRSKEKLKWKLKCFEGKGNWNAMYQNNEDKTKAVLIEFTAINADIKKKGK